LNRVLRIVAVAGLLAACANRPFPSRTTVKSVRLLAVKSDLPYAHPGETVNLEALAWDGREHPTLPMHFYWFPTPCLNPTGGEYFDCYSQLEAEYPNLHEDISPQLDEGFTHQVEIPTTALDGVVQEAGRPSAELFATSWTFLAACAGHIERRQRTTNYAENEAPFGCFGPDGVELPAEQGLFGFTRVTVSQTSRNASPTIKKVFLRSKEIDPINGATFVRCTKSFIDLHTNGNCDTLGMEIAFDDSDAEIDAQDVDANGHPGRETLYTDWFVTTGRFTEDRRVQYDPFKGRPQVGQILFEPPREAGKGILWVVFHDNRGGVSWTSFPLQIVPGPDTDGSRFD
jgi:hypothetical protein